MPITSVAHRSEESKLRINGVAVRIIRESMDIHASALAKKAGISPSYLSRLETGARQATHGKIVKIASSLGVPCEAISYPDSKLVGEK